MTTGETIAVLRESRKVLQKDLAKAINVDPVVLNRIEKDKRPARGDELKAIADYFNVSTDYLLGRDSSKGRKLTNEQSMLLSWYDDLTEQGRRRLWEFLDYLKFQTRTST